MESTTTSNGNDSVMEIDGKSFKFSGEVIGRGTFGFIRKGINITTKELVAIKVQYHPDPNSNKSNEHVDRVVQLADEHKFYKMLGNIEGIPKIYYFGSYEKGQVLVMELLGANLRELFRKCNGKFSVKTVAQIGLQLLDRFEHIHSSGLIHRDIKPSNFLLGASNSDKANVFHVIDFALARQLIDAKTGKHIRFTVKKDGLIGTVRYMSINANMANSQSRRDDLEALGYMLVNFVRGRLPWQSMKGTTDRETIQLICDKKQSISIEQLCEECPKEFGAYFRYVKPLGFAKEPDYEYLRGLFRNMLEREGTELDGIYDWTDKL